MTLNQIRAFEALSKHLNMTRAAESLSISQPSVFKQVKSLEDFCGVRLYRKVGREIELTREGRLVHADLREILQRIERLGRRFNRPAPDGGLLAIGGSHAPSAALIPSLLGRFKQTHPNTQIIFRTKSSRGIEELVLQGEIEIGVVTNPSKTRLLRLLPCRPENVEVIVSPSHPLARKSFAWSLPELAQAPLIIKKGRRGKPSEVLKRLESHGYRLNVLMECESAQAIKVAAMRGMGVGILYRDQVESELRDGSLKALRIAGMKRITGRSFIIYRKDGALTQNALDCIELLREPQREEPAPAPAWACGG